MSAVLVEELLEAGILLIYNKRRECIGSLQKAKRVYC